VASKADASGQAFIGASFAGYPGAGAPPFPSSASPVSFAAPSSPPPSLFSPIDWLAGADRPDSLALNAVVAGSGGTEAWRVWFPPDRDSVALPRPPDSIWNALGWKDADYGLLVASYCDPEPGTCKDSQCTPTEEPRCERWASSIPNVQYDLAP
jgi:hypothetical protein